MISRRNFLISAAAILPSIFLPSALASDFWSQPRWLHVRRTRTGEEANVCYFANGQIQENGYQTLCHIFRDVRADSRIDIHPVLLDILCGMQGWFRAYGQDRTIMLNSGYRTVATNNATEGAKKNSFHLRGEAADVWMPNIPTEYLARLAVYLQGGGVGIYQAKNFIHVDKGALRVWNG